MKINPHIWIVLWMSWWVVWEAPKCFVGSERVRLRQYLQSSHLLRHTKKILLSLPSPQGDIALTPLSTRSYSIPDMAFAAARMIIHREAGRDRKSMDCSSFRGGEVNLRVALYSEYWMTLLHISYSGNIIIQSFNI